MRKAFEIGGIVAAVVLIAFGIGAIAMGINGRSTVQSNLAQEQITFGDASKDATVPAKYSGQLVNTGDKARAFAQMMRHHTLEATQGLTYSQMGRFAAKAGTPAKLTDGQGGTNDPMYAATDAKGAPVSNSARDLWVTETALTTALNTAYMAERVRAVRNRHRDRPAALRDRVRDPGDRRSASEQGDGLRVHQQADGEDPGSAGRISGPLHRRAHGPPQGGPRGGPAIPPGAPARARSGRARRGSSGEASA